MSYVFDTDVLSLLMKRRLPEHARRLVARVPSEEARTTSITLGELYFGALRSAATTQWLEAIEKLRCRLTCLPFDAEASRSYGELRAHLERQGSRLDDPDLRIAAICRAGGHTLVSGNARHFLRVPGLRYENWLAEQ